MKKQKKSKKEILEYYRKHPDIFIEKRLGVKLWSGMRIVIDSVWKNKRTSVRACHGVSKCRERNELIQLSNGEIIPLYKLIGKEFEIETPKGFKKAYASDNGKQKIKVVALGNGTVIKITENHPLYVAKKSGNRNRYLLGRKEFLNVIGFTSDINQGDCIAVPIKTNSKNNIKMPEEEVKLLAYVIGDGSTRGGGVTITTADKKVVEDINIIANYYGVKVRKYNKYDYKFSVGQRGGSPNPIIDLMREFGIMGNLAKDKHIPSKIFRLNEEQICIFLAHIYMCDGHVICKKGIGNRTITQIVYTTVSLKLANDMYILLKRIGIKRPLIRKQKTSWTYKGIKKVGECYQVSILILKDTQLFSKKIKLWGRKGERLKLILQVERTGALRPYGKWRDDCLPGMYWEDIKSITIDEAETVAITVPEIATYITPYAYEHNTMAAAAITVAFFNLYKDSVVITTAPCYDDKTEVLTEDGWKLFKNLVDEKVACLDNGQLVFYKPEDYIKYKYKGELIEYHGRDLDFSVTPNHRCYVSKPSIGKWKEGEWDDWEIVRADNIYNKQLIKFNRECIWTGIKDKYTEKEYELWGFWFADGHARYGGKYRRCDVILTQSKYVEYAKNLLSVYGLKVSILKRIYKKNIYNGRIIKENKQSYNIFCSNVSFLSLDIFYYLFY